MDSKRTTARPEELNLSNSFHHAAPVELLEEKSILTQQDVVERMKVIRDWK